MIRYVKDKDVILFRRCYQTSIDKLKFFTSSHIVPNNINIIINFLKFFYLLSLTDYRSMINKQEKPFKSDYLITK